MPINVLRSFHYLDTQIIDDYLASIDGALVESEDVSERIATDKGISASAGAFSISVDAGIKAQIEKETKRKLVQTYASKFQKIYAYLEGDGSIPFYDNMDDETWIGINRSQFIEIDVEIRFSRIDTIIGSFGNLLPLFSQLKGSDGADIIDPNTKNTLNVIQLFQEINKQNGLPAELQLINGSQYRFIAYFNQDSFITDSDKLPNEITIFGKVQRKIGENEKINLVNVVPLFEKMAINREIRRTLKHKWRFGDSGGTKTPNPNRQNGIILQIGSVPCS